MLAVEQYITSTCSISNGTVSKDNNKAFENRGTDLSALLLSIYQHYHFNYPKFYKMDNLSKLGWLAAEILLQDGFKKDNYQPEEIGVILANSNSSLDNDLKYEDTIKEFPSPAVFVYTLPNIVIGEICIRHKFKGEHAFFIQDSFNTEFIAQQASYLLDKDILRACICGWVEVLEQDYKACLFLVEKKKGEPAVLFSAENMSGIFNKE